MDVVTIGESMVLFTPETKGYMRYASTFSSRIGGAESNMAIGLARLGHQAGWISRLGKDEFGKKILSFIRGENVDVSRVLLDDTAPTGLYFKEIVSDEEMNVQYYRSGSAASKLTPADIDEGYIGQARYLHLSGITPALSETARETVMKAIELAKKHGVTVVFDPNLRRKLWPDELAKEVLLTIISKSDIVLPGLDEGIFLFGKSKPEELAEQFIKQGAKSVVIKLGSKGAYYQNATETGFVESFHVTKVVDPVGAGDGFAAGFLSGRLDQLSFKEAVKRGAAVGAMVTKVSGDVEGLPERDQLESFIKGSSRGDVNR